MISFYSTNDPSRTRVDFITALLNGLPEDYGLYTVARDDLPHFTAEQLQSMRAMEYWQIASMVLCPFLDGSIPRDTAEGLIRQAYDPSRISTRIQRVLDTLSIMWLTGGPSFSFKDYAALFYAVVLDFILQSMGRFRLILVATSGDTGAAIAAAVRGLKRLAGVIFFPLGEISHLQRLQMDTIGENTYAIGYRGDFDTGQEIVKRLLRDQEFSSQLFGEPDMLTSANSISVGRLLPQMVYPFYAYARQATDAPFLACIPSGNFGDMMGTVLAASMGLPVKRIICGVNGNKTFPRFLDTGVYSVEKTHRSPSSAMNVAHPSNVARLFDRYGGHIFDERDSETHRILHQGVVTRLPDLRMMREHIFASSVSDPDHDAAMVEAFTTHGVVLDPHGAVGWSALQDYRVRSGDQAPAVIYETADPAKFPEDVLRALGFEPSVPEGLRQLHGKPRRIIELHCQPDTIGDGKYTPSRDQMEEAKEAIRSLQIQFG